MEASKVSNAKPVLSSSIIQPLELNQLIRELAKIDEQFTQEHLRGHKETKLDITPSFKLAKVLKEYKIDLQEKSHRTKLLEFLTGLKSNAPVMHISFSNVADEAFLEKLITRLRQSIDPQLLIIVGLEPNIGAGSVIRTNNQYFDFSLASRLKLDKKLLIENINQLSKNEVVAKNE